MISKEKLEELLRASTPEELSARASVKDPLEFLSQNYGDGDEREFILGRWEEINKALEILVNAGVLKKSFKGWNNPQTYTEYPGVIDYLSRGGIFVRDFPLIEKGRLVVRRSIKGVEYVRSLTPEELKMLDYVKTKNVYDASEDSKIRKELNAISHEPMPKKGLPKKLMTFGCDEFGDKIPCLLSIWELKEE